MQESERIALFYHENVLCKIFQKFERKRFFLHTIDSCLMESQQFRKLSSLVSRDSSGIQCANKHSNLLTIKWIYRFALLPVSIIHRWRSFVDRSLCDNFRFQLLKSHRSEGTLKRSRDCGIFINPNSRYVYANLSLVVL